MRIFWLTLAALVAIAGAAHAQVAAPRINPAVNPFPSSFNPGVLPWSGPSRAGIGVLSGGEITSTSTTGVETVETTGSDGFTGSALFVGENMAGGVEFLDQAWTLTAANGGQELELNGYSAGVAYQFVEMFSFGAGIQSSEFLQAGNGSEESIPLVGATVVLGEVFYIGAAYGAATVDTISPTAGAILPSFDRSVMRAGLGLASRDQDFGWHLEVYMDVADSAEDTTTTPGTTYTTNESETTGATLEVVIVGGAMLSVESISTDDTTFAGVADGSSDILSLSLGWVPAEGLYIVLTSSGVENTNTDNSKTNFNNYMASAGWSF